MKKYLLTLLLFSLCSAGFAQKADKKNYLSDPAKQSEISGIDNHDTVFFDIDNIGINNNKIEFPVSIISDDTIYALDFSFRYNSNHIVYDSVIDLTNYIQALAFLNGTDSTLRFTSNSMQSYQRNTPLVSVRFVSALNAIVASDLINVKAYLNGVLCTVKIGGNAVTGLNDTEYKIELTVFPNPSTGIIYFSGADHANFETAEVFSLSGKSISSVSVGKNGIDLSSVEKGIYFLRLNSAKEVITKKIVLN